MTTRLASAIAAAAAKPAGVTMRRGVAVTAGTVQLVDGVLVNVTAWAAGAPTPGQPVLLLAERGSLIGLPIGDVDGNGGSGGESVNEVTISPVQPVDGSEIWVDWDDSGPTYTFVTRMDQVTPSTSWVLDVGRQIGAIRVLDSAGNEVEPGGIQQTGTGVTLTFSAAFSGTAWVTG